MISHEGGERIFEQGDFYEPVYDFAISGVIVLCLHNLAAESSSRVRAYSEIHWLVDENTAKPPFGVYAAFSPATNFWHACTARAASRARWINSVARLGNKGLFLGVISGLFLKRWDPV